MRALADPKSKKPIPMRVSGAATPIQEWRSVEGLTFEEATKKAGQTVPKYVTFTLLQPKESEDTIGE